MCADLIHHGHLNIIKEAKKYSKDVKIDNMGKKAEAKLQKWDKPKKGSGMVTDSLRRAAARIGSAYAPRARAFARGRGRHGGSTIQRGYDRVTSVLPRGRALSGFLGTSSRQMRLGQVRSK